MVGVVRAVVTVAKNMDVNLNSDVVGKLGKEKKQHN